MKSFSRAKPPRGREGNRKFTGADKCKVPAGHFEERLGFRPLRQVAKGEQGAGESPRTEGRPAMLGGQRKRGKRKAHGSTGKICEGSRGP